MTPGEEALREAARLEAARIYGRLLSTDRLEYPQEASLRPAGAPVDIQAARQRRKKGAA